MPLGRAWNTIRSRPDGLNRHELKAGRSEPSYSHGRKGHCISTAHCDLTDLCIAVEDGAERVLDAAGFHKIKNDDIERGL